MLAALTGSERFEPNFGGTFKQDKWLAAIVIRSKSSQLELLGSKGVQSRAKSLKADVDREILKEFRRCR